MYETSHFQVADLTLEARHEARHVGGDVRLTAAAKRLLADGARDVRSTPKGLKSLLALSVIGSPIHRAEVVGREIAHATCGD